MITLGSCIATPVSVAQAARLRDERPRVDLDWRPCAEAADFFPTAERRLLLRDDRLLVLFAEREERLLLPVDREARLLADRLLLLRPVARRAPLLLLARVPVARARS